MPPPFPLLSPVFTFTFHCHSISTFHLNLCTLSSAMLSSLRSRFGSNATSETTPDTNEDSDLDGLKGGWRWRHSAHQELSKQYHLTKDDLGQFSQYLEAESDVVLQLSSYLRRNERHQRRFGAALHHVLITTKAALMREVITTKAQMDQAGVSDVGY